MSFEDSGTTVRNINLTFENNSSNGRLAAVGHHATNGKADALTLIVNMHYYNAMIDNDPNGKTTTAGAGYLDRTLAHEFTHAVMAANIDNFSELPAYIKEGMAEVVHGIDDERKWAIKQIMDSANSADLRTMFEQGKNTTAATINVGGAGGETAYAAGYVLLRYMAHQSTGGNGAMTSGSDGDTYTFNYKLTDKAFNFQVGTKANQTIRVGFADMRAKSLKLENAKQERVSVVTREKAVASLATFDYALAKALDMQTTIGSIQSRLEHTINNLTVSSENVQSSESTIRDADMAKEMTEYTKNNVLMQSAQSMLAQANQSSSSVLSLLQ